MTQDGDVRFELYEMPSKALVGRFTVSDAPTGSSMAANGVFCTREMVVSQPVRGFFAARRDKKQGISEPYALLLEIFPRKKIEAETTIAGVPASASGPRKHPEDIPKKKKGVAAA